MSLPPLMSICSCIFSFINSVGIWHTVMCSNLRISSDSYLPSFLLSYNWVQVWIVPGFSVWHPVWSLQHGRQSPCIGWESCHRLQSSCWGKPSTDVPLKLTRCTHWLKILWWMFMQTSINQKSDFLIQFLKITQKTQTTKKCVIILLGHIMEIYWNC